MSDPMAEIRASFFVECEELLEALQDGLTKMETDNADPEVINVCFRAVHSIKGGAGAFGLDSLVRFAHRYETVMDEVRSGRLVPDPDAVMLFLRAADVLSDIVRASRDAETLNDEDIETTLRRLEALVGTEVVAAVEGDDDEEAPDFQPTMLSFDLDGPPGLEDLDRPPLSDETTAGPTTYSIRFAPGPELFASGNEPRHLLNALADLGTLTTTALTDRVPDLAAIRPDEAYLTWHLKLVTPHDLSRIEEVFEFVAGICGLEISPVGTDAPNHSGTSPTTSAELAIATNATAGLPPTDNAGAAAPRTRLTLSEPATGNPLPSALEVPDRFPTIGALETESGTDDPGLEPDVPAFSQTDPEASTLEHHRDRPAHPEGPGRPVEKAASPDIRTHHPSTPQVKPTVRVDLERVDRLVNLVGELVINQAMLTQSAQEAGLHANSKVSQGLDEFLQLTRDIQESVMMIRAQPVKSLFQRMSRIVREASLAVDKRARLVTHGETTEVDKTVIERLADPLTHMIRNAVDHGLEDADTRIRAGKAPDGTVTLSANHRSGRVLIEVADDGAGLDRAKIQKIAEDKGLIPTGLTLSTNDIDNLLFLPGFSTANKLSDLSGRGVGMDVVRSAIQELGGRITIDSELGKGTTFSISLPLTLAVLDGMVVKSAGETLVVPLGVIVETLALQDSDVTQLRPGVQVLQVRNSFVPLLDLGVELGFRDPLTNYDGYIVLLLAKEDGAHAAVIIDRIDEQRQVVIKGLQESYGYVPGISAATILGDGRVALIVDAVDLFAKQTDRPEASLATHDMAATA